MHLSILRPATPFQGDVREEVGIWIMQKSNASPAGQASQSNPDFPPTKKMWIYEGTCLLMFTLLYMCMVSSQIPQV